MKIAINHSFEVANLKSSITFCHPKRTIVRYSLVLVISYSIQMHSAKLLICTGSTPKI